MGDVGGKGRFHWSWRTINVIEHFLNKSVNTSTLHHFIITNSTNSMHGKLSRDSLETSLSDEGLGKRVREKDQTE